SFIELCGYLHAGPGPRRDREDGVEEQQHPAGAGVDRRAGHRDQTCRQRSVRTATTSAAPPAITEPQRVGSIRASDTPAGSSNAVVSRYPTNVARSDGRSPPTRRTPATMLCTRTAAESTSRPVYCVWFRKRPRAPRATHHTP